MELSHIDKKGNATMVDVSNKQNSVRTAVATGTISMSPTAFEMVTTQNIKKGDVLTVSKVAGIMAAKNTSNIIPMCHQLSLSFIDVDIQSNDDLHTFTVISTAKTTDKTGVEMEALTAVHITLLTMYDMIKAVDKKMIISNIHLVSKTGGKSGGFTYEG